MGDCGNYIIVMITMYDLKFSLRAQSNKYVVYVTISSGERIYVKII